jgi:hypothetical protein
MATMRFEQRKAHVHADRGCRAGFGASDERSTLRRVLFRWEILAMTVGSGQPGSVQLSYRDDASTIGNRNVTLQRSGRMPSPSERQNCCYLARCCGLIIRSAAVESYRHANRFGTANASS